MRTAFGQPAGFAAIDRTEPRSTSQYSRRSFENRASSWTPTNRSRCAAQGSFTKAESATWAISGAADTSGVWGVGSLTDCGSVRRSLFRQCADPGRVVLLELNAGSQEAFDDREFLARPAFEVGAAVSTNRSVGLLDDPAGALGHG